MTIVIGTDEAGYGPNLGPLVVAATAWRIDTPPDAADAALARAGAAIGAAAGGPRWADSKHVYKSGQGLAALEHGVFTGLLAATGGLPADWPALAGLLGPIGPRPEALAPAPEWQSLESLTLPHATAAAACRTAAAAIAAPLTAAGAGLVAVACRAIYPDEFNDLLASGLNKSDILSQATLTLAAAARERFPGEPAAIWCDRHGGRKSYAPLVARHFGSSLVRPLEETPRRSRYVLPAGPGGAEGVIEFSVGGESRLPVALASMTAKYVRELAMHAFNTFWSGRMAGLRPTAGYPVDAARWRQDAAEAIRLVGAPEHRLWRRA